MAGFYAADDAWDDLVEYAGRPGATVETAAANNTNYVGVGSDGELRFRTDDGEPRTVSRGEFGRIWRRLRADGAIARNAVGDVTAQGAGSALFGAMNDVFPLELDRSTDSMCLRLPDES